LAKNKVNVEKYKAKALNELKEIAMLLKRDSLFLCVSRSYYAAFYAIKALLESIGIHTGSHKQSQIEFRKNFIKTGKLPNEYSEVLAELSELRGKADYDINWGTNKVFVERIVKEAREFVSTILDVI